VAARVRGGAGGGQRDGGGVRGAARVPRRAAARLELAAAWRRRRGGALHRRRRGERGRRRGVCQGLVCKLQNLQGSDCKTVFPTILELK